MDVLFDCVSGDNSKLGTSMAAGDLDGDGYNDIVLGDPGRVRGF